ncbi:hypothetical protein [Paenalkalicoccus suaedae]|nr:hypothetical protein [Paenalkalicoccus suaedae]
MKRAKQVKRGKKKLLWRDMLKRKWDEVNRLPDKQSLPQTKSIA